MNKWWKYRRLDKWHENYVIENNDGNVEWMENCIEFDVSNGFISVLEWGWDGAEFNCNSCGIDCIRNGSPKVIVR
jgi:hypothetical protein